MSDERMPDAERIKALTVTATRDASFETRLKAALELARYAEHALALEQLIPALQKDRDSLNAMATLLAKARAERDALEQSLKDVLGLIEDGWLVRDTTHDAEPGWAVRQLPRVQQLGKASALLAARSPEKEGP